MKCLPPDCMSGRRLPFLLFKKARNDEALYDNYIALCVKNGIDRDEIQNFMDYQTMTDFLISNTDEHLQNFGVLRDTDSMRLIGIAPIFDSGNSMFFVENRKTPYSRVELLEKQITGFYKTEEKMLAKVKDKSLVKMDLLPAAEEVTEIYVSAGLPEERADFISKNYSLKLQLFHKFQKGKTISLYREKQAEKLKTGKR